MQNRIRDLCHQLVHSQDPDVVEMLGAQLRCELHDYVLELRHQAQAIPFLTGSSPDMSLD